MFQESMPGAREAFTCGLQTFREKKKNQQADPGAPVELSENKQLQKQIYK